MRRSLLHFLAQNVPRFFFLNYIHVTLLVIDDFQMFSRILDIIGVELELNRESDQLDIGRLPVQNSIGVVCVKA